MKIQTNGLKCFLNQGRLGRQREGGHKSNKLSPHRPGRKQGGNKAPHQEQAPQDPVLSKWIVTQSQRGVRMCLVISAGESLVIRVMCRFGLAAAVQLPVSPNSPNICPNVPHFPLNTFFIYTIMECSRVYVM